VAEVHAGFKTTGHTAADIAAGCDPEQAGNPSHASPLTTLAHVGEPGEVEGREEVCVS
jgi:hypothetical protein